MSNVLNVMDKGFFAKTMAEYAKMNANKIVKSSELKFNSVDDFAKHFDCFKNLPKMERVPAKDTFQVGVDEIPTMF